VNRLFIFFVCSFLIISCQNKNDGSSHLLATLVTLPDDSEIIDKYFDTDYPIDKYAILSTDLNELPFYFGTTEGDEQSVFWMKYGKQFSLFGMKKDTILNVYRDTIRNTFDNETKMISFEMIYNPLFDEVRYNWLDENDKTSSKYVIVDIDKPLALGKLFPNLTVDKLNGDKLDFSNLRGKIVLVNWWHTRCGGCLLEINGLNKLYEKYKNNSNITFIAISTDDKERLISFLDKNEFMYAQTLATKEMEKVFGDGYPVNIIITPDGEIHDNIVGGSENTYLKIEKELLKIIE